jgi:hypothetical protein
MKQERKKENVNIIVSVCYCHLQTFCRFKFYVDDKPTTTATVADTINPSYNFEKIYTYNAVTQGVCTASLIILGTMYLL